MIRSQKIRGMVWSFREMFFDQAAVVAAGVLIHRFPCLIRNRILSHNTTRKNITRYPPIRHPSSALNHFYISQLFLLYLQVNRVVIRYYIIIIIKTPSAVRIRNIIYANLLFQRLDQTKFQFCSYTVKLHLVTLLSHSSNHIY